MSDHDPLPPVLSPSPQETTQYELTVYTSDIRGAGTDAEVYLTLSGDHGSAEEIKLYNGPKNFSRGAVDKFLFKAKDVGTNKRLSFRLVSPREGPRISGKRQG